jgi:hypothetical protein
MITRKPLGHFNAALDVTECSWLSFNRQHIDNLAMEMAGSAPAVTGDAIVGGERGLMDFSVWLGGKWECHKIPSLECARAYVAGYREANKEAA